MSPRNAALAVVADDRPGMPAGPAEIDLSIMEQVIALGDLANLSKEQRLTYYRAVCDSLHLNWRTQPFGYIKLNNKLVLYALKNAAEQLRQVYGVSIVDIRTEQVGDLYVVTVTAKDRTGRLDSDMGVVPIGGLRGDALANGMKKALTQAKRRVTLSICGLGMLDETEASQVPDARIVAVDDDGELGAETENPAEPAVDERAKQNRRYHAVGFAHGWSDAALHLFAVAMIPEREHGKTTSRTQLTAQELGDLADIIEHDIGRIVDGETGEVEPTPEVEFACIIAAAQDRVELARIAAQLKADGIAAPWLKRMWKHRNGEVPAAVRLVEAEESSDETAGDDRHTR